MRRIVVKKYGGACLSDQERMTRIAKSILADTNDVVVVVSARKGETDRLLTLMDSYHPKAADEVRAVLLATGELESAALLTAIIDRCGRKAEIIVPWNVFTTDNASTDANILKVRTEQVLACLERGAIPVVPGFFGATAEGKLATLGRGGTDYSAVALGAALGAKHIELIKAEVDGLYSADPNVHSDAEFFPSLTHEEALALARSGAKALNEKAASLAHRQAVSVWIRPAFTEGPGTHIGHIVNKIVDDIVDNNTAWICPAFTEGPGTNIGNFVNKIVDDIVDNNTV